MKKNSTFLFAAIGAALAVLGVQAKFAAPSRGGETVPKIVYSETFDSLEAFRTFTVIDANNDKTTWRYNKDKRHAECLYSSKEQTDDWLITPEIDLEAGKVYQVSFKAWGSGTYYTEKLSVSYGSGTDLTAYATIFPSIDINYGAVTFSNHIAISTDGKYRLGFHAESPKNQYALNIDDIEVKEVATAAAPAASGMMKAVPDNAGKLEATVSFISPTKTIAGQALGGLTKIEILRDSTVIKTYENPAAGHTFSFVDDTALNGNHTYTVVAYNASGAGLPISTTIYVGEDMPDVVSQVKLADNGDHYTLSWKAPTKGAAGRFFSGQNLRYNIYIPNGVNQPVLFKKNCEGTTLNIDSIGGAQEMVRFQVAAVNGAGEGAKTNSNVILVGDVYDLPVAESFDNGKTDTHHYWWRDSRSQAYWSLSTNGYILWFPDNEYDEAWWNSGKIDLSKAVKPTVSFRYNIVAKSKTAIQVEAQKSNQEIVVLGYVNGNTTKKNGWHSHKIDLSSLKNESYVILKFHSIADDTEYIGLDDINIADATEHNLAVKIDVPPQGTAGLPLSVKTIVSNYGSKPSTQFVIRLFMNGQQVAEKTVSESIPSLGIATYTLSAVPQIATETVEVYALIDYAPDEALADNTSTTVRIPLLQPHSKTVNNLSAAAQGTDKTLLAWTAPEVKTVQQTDDFESYEPFVVGKEGSLMLQHYNIGPWALFDGDQEYSIALPGYDFGNMEECFSYMVFNPSKVATNGTSASTPKFDTHETFAAHSGKQYMASFSINSDMAIRYQRSDDWLISPQLTGDSQTVSFWANSLPSGSNGPASFEVLYSTTDTLAGSFIAIQPQQNAPAFEWTRFTIELPDGARYFAIRCTTPMSSMQVFMIDDITYTTGDGAIRGYNLYRDGQRIATLSATATQYEDNVQGNHNYQITVIYNGGESGYSNTASTATGISRPHADNSQSEDVYTVDGQKLPQLRKGVNIVRMSNGKIRKIVVK